MHHLKRFISICISTRMKCSDEQVNGIMVSFSPFDLVFHFKETSKEENVPLFLINVAHKGNLTVKMYNAYGI